LTNNFSQIKSGILKYQDAFLFFWVILIIFIFTVCENAFTQTNDDIYSKEPELYKSAFKKIELENRIFDDTLKEKVKEEKFEMKKSPWKAVLFSAVVPGMGQLYNESYWKVPVVMGLGGFLLYEIIYYNNRFSDYKDLYAQSITPENPYGDDILRQYREFYRNQRDQFYLYAGFYYLINLVDAYVDAHLFDFNVSEKIRMSISGGNSLNLKVSF